VTFAIAKTFLSKHKLLRILDQLHVQ